MRASSLYACLVLATASGCAPTSDVPARDAGINRVFATVRGVT